MDPLLSTATRLAAAIRSRELSAAEALDAHLGQIDRHNGALNAVVILDADRAREQARAADAALARGEVWGPLHGVPFTLKDAFATAGMRSTVGSPLFDYVPDEDATVVARLKAAGGILMGKTNVAELLGDYQTDNPIFGRTNNPWDPARTPGGSSGGAAAALAAGMTPFEIATDLAGSIRIPAHFCGVFGFKPTEHRVSLAGAAPDPHDSPRAIRIMSSLGPMARAAEDLALLYGIIAGADGRDTDVAPVPIDLPPTADKLRIAVAPTFAGLPVAADIRSAVERTARELARLGAVVEEASLPPIDLAAAGALIGMVVEATQPDAQATLVQYMAALQQRDRSIMAWEDFFDRWDALLCPPSMTAAFPHCEPGTPLNVDGRNVDYFTVSAHTMPFNYTGHPAVVVPSGLDAATLPIGVQVVAKRWADAKVLAIAEVVARVSGGF